MGTSRLRHKIGMWWARRRGKETYRYGKSPRIIIALNPPKGKTRVTTLDPR